MLSPTIQAALKAEQEVIGCILMDNSTIDVIRGIVSIKDFYAEYNREIFQAVCDLSEKGEEVNTATLLSKLVSAKSFNDNGGVELLTRATSNLPNAILADLHAKNVRKHSVMRTLETIGTSIKESACADIDVYEYISKVKDELESLADCETNKPWVSIGEAISKAVTTIKDVKDGNKQDIAKTGFVDLDEMLSGLRPGALTIIAARPAMGKTSFGLNIMSNVAEKCGVPVAFFSLEMTSEELALRTISSTVGIPGSYLKQGKITNDEFGKILDYWGKEAKTNIYIDETAGIDILALRDRTKQMHKRYGIGLVIVDYLQLVRSGNKRIQNREQEVSDVSRGLKGIAKDLHVPVIALAQLNRNVDTRADKHPVISDLRESGSIEQDADNIIFIHREDRYKSNAEQDHIAEIIVAKQRSGPTGTVKLHWDGKYTRFDNLDKYF